MKTLAAVVLMWTLILWPTPLTAQPATSSPAEVVSSSSPGPVTVTTPEPSKPATPTPVKVDPVAAQGSLQALAKFIESFKTGDLILILVALCNLLTALMKSPLFQSMVNKVVNRLLKITWRPSKRQKIVMAVAIASVLATVLFHGKPWYKIVGVTIIGAAAASGLRSWYKHFIEIPLNGRSQEE